jgi:shikimate kinase
MRLFAGRLCQTPSRPWQEMERRMYHRDLQQDLQQLTSRRRSFMIEVADAFLTGDHGENLSIEQVSETGHDMLG